MATPETDDNGPVQAELPGRSVLVLFGSETGNSQDIAEELAEMAQRLHFKTDIEEMDQVDLSMLLRYTLVIFVVSTAGQGDMPYNAMAFWKSLLRKKLPPTCLSRLKFTSFGLGDSTYTKYNWAVRKLHKRLEQLGGVEFFPRGEADEQHEDGSDTAYLPWAADLRKELLSGFPLPSGLSPIPEDTLLPPRYPLIIPPATMGVSSSKTKEEDVGGDTVPRTPTNTSNTEPDGTRDASKPVEYDNRGVVAGHSKSSAATYDDGRAAESNRLLQPLSFLEEEVKRADLASGDLIMSKIMPSHPKEPHKSIISNNSISTGALPAPTTPRLPSNKPLPIPRGFDAVLVTNKRVTPTSHWQDVRHLVFDIAPGSKGRLPVRPGDCITLYPKNFPEDVQKLIELMGWEEIADRRLKLKGSTVVPQGFWPFDDSTLRDILTHNLDICAVPRRSFLRAMAFFTKTTNHRERLVEFTMAEYKDEYYDYATRPRRTILETLEEFTSVKLPANRVLDIFPVIRGRDFSIANGGVSSNHPTDKDSTRVELVVALVKYKIILRKPRVGVCSRYIDHLPNGTLLRVTYKPSQSRLYGPVHAKRPLLAMATGTGIAPIRSLIWERREFDHGDTYLFFGNRNRAADFFFEGEWAGMVEEAKPDGPRGNGPVATRPIFKTYTTFSRDQTQKVYIQHLIKQEVELVTRMILENAIFLVCGGSTRMADACKDSIKQCIRAGGLAETDEEADAVFRKLTWWQEIW